MKLKYKNALGIMYQGEPTLAKVIQKFVNEFPEAFQRKINLGRENGITSGSASRRPSPRASPGPSDPAWWARCQPAGRHAASRWRPRYRRAQDWWCVR